MKTGRSLTEFYAQLQLENSQKRDFLTTTDMLNVTPGAEVVLSEGPALEMGTTFQQQLATHIGYPFNFFSQTRDQHPQQWSALTNVMLHSDPKPRMIRTLDNKARAFLSNKFRRIDNWEVIMTALNAVADHAGWEVVSSELTEKRVYLKVLTPLIKDVQVGDPVQAGWMISNSEIGLGSLDVEMFVHRLRCRNGMWGFESVRKNHLGSAFQLEDGSSTRQLFSDETLQLSDRALLAQVGDVIKATVDDSKFALVVDKFAESVGLPITGKPEKVVELTSKQFLFSEQEANSVLRKLIDQGDGMNKFGLVNAITATAQNEEITFARSIELEQIGGKLLNMPVDKWNVLASVN